MQYSSKFNNYNIFDFVLLLTVCLFQMKIITPFTAENDAQPNFNFKIIQLARVIFGFETPGLKTCVSVSLSQCPQLAPSVTGIARFVAAKKFAIPGLRLFYRAGAPPEVFQPPTH
jgi:hypothetical protein